MQKPYKILVVDDDADDHFLFKDAISQMNISFEIVSLFNGLELLEYLNKNIETLTEAVDLIVMDINMPSMNGITALSHIKKDSALKKIPVFILSTAQDDSEYKKCSELGVSRCFTKPNSGNGLKKILREIFSHPNVSALKK